MKIIKGLTLINYIEDLKRVPKIAHNINYYYKISKEEGKYNFDFSDMIMPSLVNIFFKESLLLPEGIFEFIDLVFKNILNPREKEVLDYFIQIAQRLSTPYCIEEDLEIKNIQVDSRSFYIFRESVIKTIKGFSDLKEESNLKQLLVSLLSFKKDSEIIEIYNKIKNKYKVSYRPDWDFFLRAVSLFTIYSEKELIEIMDTYNNSEKKLESMTKSSVPIRAFVKENDITYVKNPQIEFCRVGIYEGINDLNIMLPEKLLKNFNLDWNIFLDWKEILNSEEKISIKNLLSEELNTKDWLFNFLGYMGTNLEEYNAYRELINLFPLNVNYYIISTDAIILDSSPNFDRVVSFVEENNLNIKRFIKDLKKEIKSEYEIIKDSLEYEISLKDLSLDLGYKPKDMLMLILKNNSLLEKMFETISEEKDYGLSLNDEKSFFYGCNLSNLQIEQYIIMVESKIKRKKKPKIKSLTYKILTKIVEKLTEGMAYSSVISTLKYDYKLEIKKSKLIDEIIIYFGEEVIEEIKQAQIRRKRKGERFGSF